MKILKDKYPMGTLRYQKSDGRYINEYLYENLKGLAEVIKNDMTFLGIGFSSTLEVGTGKSVLFTQIGEAWSYLMKEIHGDSIPFTSQNLVWRPKALIERSFEVPKYSCIVLDEWEDAHYWSELGMTLRQFFRKCRQLNLFILIIIPNFFQLPPSYALGRSVFAIDIKFQGKFERGFFDFYNFDAKRELYLKGKKTQNYKVTKPTFQGRFTDGYGIPEDEYRKAKLEDLKMWDEDEKKDKDNNPHEIKRQIVSLIKKKFSLIDINKPTLSLARIFNVDERTIQRWVKDKECFDTDMATGYIKNTNKKDYVPVVTNEDLIISEDESNQSINKQMSMIT